MTLPSLEAVPGSLRWHPDGTTAHTAGDRYLQLTADGGTDWSADPDGSARTFNASALRESHP